MGKQAGERLLRGVARRGLRVQQAITAGIDRGRVSLIQDAQVGLTPVIGPRINMRASLVGARALIRVTRRRRGACGAMNQKQPWRCQRSQLEWRKKNRNE